MPLKIVDLDTIQPNGKPGDPARTAFVKINDNTTVLEQALSDLDQEIADRQALAEVVGTKASNADLISLTDTVNSQGTAIGQKASNANLISLTGIVNSQGTAIGQKASTAQLTEETNARNSAIGAINTVLGTYKSAAKADILGTVSSSGGVPTGAIMESGSNANGNYFKFANGMLVCTRAVGPIGVPSGGIYNSSTQTFAAAFSSVPICALQISSSFPYLIDGNYEAGINLTGCKFSINNRHTSTISDIYAGVLAVGRWN